MEKGTSATYTSFDVNSYTELWKLYPHRAGGRFSFTTPTGTSYCSATSISNNRVVTAAHCVFDTPSRNQFFTNKVFTPAYSNGSAPYGSFATTSCWILTAWQSRSGSYAINSWARYDVAVCSVGTNSAGQTVNNAVGWAGRSWNFNYTQLLFLNGWPWKYYTDNNIPSGAGQYQRACIAETRQQATDVLGLGCNWGRGASGGSWLRQYKPLAGGAANYVNSVYSGFFIGQQNAYGIRFTSNNIVPLCASGAANC